MLGSECDLKTYVQNLGYTIPIKIGAPNHLLRQIRNLTATLAACIFGMKHDIHSRANTLFRKKVCYR